MQRKLLFALTASAMMSGPLAAQEASTSVTQPGSNPPGAISPGAPSDAATSSDVATGAYAWTNPSAGTARASAGATVDPYERDRVDPDRRPLVDQYGRPLVDEYGRPIVSRP